MDNTTIDRKRREYEQVPLEDLIKAVKYLQDNANDCATLARVAGEVLKGRAQDIINGLSA